MRRVALYIILFTAFIGQAQRADSALFMQFHQDVTEASKNLESDSISIFNTIKAFKNHEQTPFKTYQSIVARKDGKIYIQGIENGFYYDGNELIQILDINKRINRLPLSQVSQLAQKKPVADFNYGMVKQDSISITAIGDVTTYHWYTIQNQINSIHISINKKKKILTRIEYGYMDFQGDHITKSVIDYRIEKTKDSTIAVSLDDFIKKSADGKWITKGKFSDYSFFDARASMEGQEN